MFIFEKLEVYKKAYSLNQKIYRFIKTNRMIPRYMKEQLGRASLSIQLNIAEGSGRFAKRDRRNFFVISRSSALECASLLDFLLAENEISKELHDDLKSGYEEISKMLYAMIKNLEASATVGKSS